MATAIPANSFAATIDVAARVIDGAFEHRARETRFRGVSTDSRTIGGGGLFVALQGASHDGHAYLREVAARGGAAAIVKRGRAIGELACIEVADPLYALGELARFHLSRARAARSLPVIAIGGSAGKTTTKEMVAALARALFGPTLSTAGNLNNLIGVPMTLLALTEEHRAAVIECGTSARGEIRRLGEIVAPDVALVLNADIEHSEGLGALEEIADEEAALFGAARRIAVTSADEPLLLARIPARLGRLTFGESANAEVRLRSRAIQPGGRSRIVLNLAAALVDSPADRTIEVTLEIAGKAAAINAAAAIASIAAAIDAPLGRAQIDSMAAAIAAVGPVAGRLAVRTISGMTVIDDSYNANPRSVRASIAAAREIAAERNSRLVIALGDMLELGGLANEMHAGAVNDVMRAAPSAFIAVGPEMARACRGAKLDGASARLAADSIEATRIVRDLVRAGDTVLIKGSRGMAMERIVEALADRESLRH